MLHASFARRHKRDATHAEIAETLEQFGWSVKDTSKLGDDFPDMVIGKDGVTDLVEAKSRKGKLSDGQSDFAEKWRGRPVLVIKSRDEAVKWATKELHERRRESAARPQIAACAHRTETP